MSIFSDLIGGSTSPLEQSLIAAAIPVLMQNYNIPAGEAEKRIREIIRVAKRDASKQGTDKLPQNLADHLLASDDPGTRREIQLKRDDGVRDADFRWWWNLPDLEKRVILKLDDLHRTHCFFALTHNGLSDSEAAQRMRKYNAMYGDVEDTTHTKGDDRPLPFELKDRVNAWIQAHLQSSQAILALAMETSSTFNALVRAEIRRGTL